MSTHSDLELGNNTDLGLLDKFDFQTRWDKKHKNLPPCDILNNPTSVSGINEAFMHNGSHWNKLAPMSMPRDRPACSSVYKNGSVSHSLEYSRCF